MFAAFLCAAFVIGLGLLLWHELGPNGVWVQVRDASWRQANRADVQERAAARALHPTTGRSVLGTPRDWRDAA